MHFWYVLPKGVFSCCFVSATRAVTCRDLAAIECGREDTASLPLFLSAFALGWDERMRTAHAPMPHDVVLT